MLIVSLLSSSLGDIGHSFPPGQKTTERQLKRLAVCSRSASGTKYTRFRRIASCIASSTGLIYLFTHVGAIQTSSATHPWTGGSNPPCQNPVSILTAAHPEQMSKFFMRAFSTVEPRTPTPVNRIPTPPGSAPLKPSGPTPTAAGGSEQVSSPVVKVSAQTVTRCCSLSTPLPLVGGHNVSVKYSLTVQGGAGAGERDAMLVDEPTRGGASRRKHLRLPPDDEPGRHGGRRRCRGRGAGRGPIAVLQPHQSTRDVRMDGA